MDRSTPRCAMGSTYMRLGTGTEPRRTSIGRSMVSLLLRCWMTLVAESPTSVSAVTDTFILQAQPRCVPPAARGRAARAMTSIATRRSNVQAAHDQCAAAACQNRTPYLTTNASYAMTVNAHNAAVIRRSCPVPFVRALCAPHVASMSCALHVTS